MTNWLAVVAAAHVDRASVLGIVQTNHGKRAGIARMSPGDTIVYYSPTEQLGNSTKLQAFTAIGTIADEQIWQADEGDFKPFRRRVHYAQARRVPLADVRDDLHLTAQRNWGYRLRRGLLELDDHDAHILAGAMTR